MESTSPAKKFHTSVNDLQMTECRREFKLPQQFPSMATSSKGNIILKVKNKSNVSSNGMPSKAVKRLTTGNNTPTMGKIKKLRIKLQDGRDLGEINVRFLSQKDELNAKTITVTKSNLFNNLNKPVTLSVLPTQNPAKYLSISPMQHKNNGSRNSTATIKSSYNDASQTLNMHKAEMGNMMTKLIHKPLILTRKDILGKTELHENGVRNDAFPEETVQKKKALYITQNGKKELCGTQSNSNSAPRYVKLQQNKKVILTCTKNNGDLTSKKNNYGNSGKLYFNKNTFPAVSKQESCNPERASVKSKHWQLAKSKFPIVKCEKLTLSKSNSSKFNKAPGECSKTETLVNFKSTHDGQDSVSAVNNEECIKEIDSTVDVSLTPTQESNNTSKQYWKKNLRNNKSISSRNSMLKEVNLAVSRKKSIVSEDSQQSEPVSRENIIAAVCNNTSDILNSNSNNAKEKDSTSTPTSSESIKIVNKESSSVSNSKISATATTESQDTSSKNNNSHNIDNGTTENCPINTNEQERLSHHWNIIKKAVSSVKDEELRAQALKALADCGIGIERHVPIQPPEELKGVHDSQIQTEVFGLLDLDSFVLVKEDQPNVMRIKQTERTVPNLTASNMNTVIQANSKQNNLIDNEHLFLGPAFVSPVDNIFDIDTFFNEFCNENIGANKVKEVLSKPNSLSMKVSMQLQKDFEGIKQWDENGMLNIHRAVANDNVNDVRRLLMVLKACKQSVDLQTEDGMTSLELAVKSNASLDIVKLLLQAAAQPVPSKLVHDSALILASKTSSPVLPELVKYVIERKSLDQVDSTGFAPLHYCAIFGNLEGTTALIQAEAKINLRDNRSGRTPLFHALENNQVAVAQKLLDHGALVNIPNFAAQTVLSLADDVKNLSLRTALNKVIM